MCVAAMPATRLAARLFGRGRRLIRTAKPGGLASARGLELLEQPRQIFDLSFEMCDPSSVLNYVLPEEEILLEQPVIGRPSRPAPTQRIPVGIHALSTFESPLV